MDELLQMKRQDIRGRFQLFAEITGRQTTWAGANKKADDSQTYRMAKDRKFPGHKIFCYHDFNNTRDLVMLQYNIL